MTAQACPVWLDANLPEDSPALLRRMLVVSLALHLAVMALVGGVRFPPEVVRLEATEVTLVSLPHREPAPAPAPEPVQREPAPEPAEAQPTPTPRPVEPAPIPPLALPTPPTRASAPVASEEPVLPSIKENMTLKAADKRLRDALRGIERPPEAPRLGEYRRAPVPPSPADTKKPQQKQPSLTDLAKQLETLQRPRPKAPVASTPKPAAKPVTAIRVKGDDTGLTRYLGLVQGKISEQWVAPPVDVGNRLYQVVVKFRLHRSGRVSEVTIELGSGNGYYDDAAKRAVLSVGQLPPFPAYVTEEVLETHFSFTVGEEVG